MSAKNYLVLVYHKGQEATVVSDPKEKFYSKKEAQRIATAHVQTLGAERAEVVECVAEVK